MTFAHPYFLLLLLLLPLLVLLVVVATMCVWLSGRWPACQHPVMPCVRVEQLDVVQEHGRGRAGMGGPRGPREVCVCGGGRGMPAGVWVAVAREDGEGQGQRL